MFKSLALLGRFLIVTLALFDAVAQTPARLAEPGSINRKDLREMVQVLTSDSLAGRETGTVGQRRAAAYIAKKFESFGLHPWGSDGYQEKFKLERRYWGDVYLEVDGARLENFKDVVYQGADEVNTAVEKELVFGGNGSDAHLNAIDVRDKMVLAFVPNLHAYYELSVNLKRRKAFGLIIAAPSNEKQFETVKSMFRDYQLEKRMMLQASETAGKRTKTRDSTLMVKTFMIPNSQIRKLMGLSVSTLTKYIGEGNTSQVQPRRIKVKCEKIVDEIESSNVIGVIRGKTEKSIYISAHYDHLGKTGSTYFPGADDNGSGSAAMLELAQEFSKEKKLNYNLVFLAMSGEEQGLLGSSYHVSRPTFAPENVLADLNIDMIGGVDANHPNAKQYMYAIGVDSASMMEKVLLKADSLSGKCDLDYSMNAGYPQGIYARSDQYNFYRKGITSVFFFTGLHKDYHRTTDTIEKIDFENLENRVHVIAEVIRLLQTVTTVK